NKPPVAVANADPLTLVLVPGRQVTAQLIGKGSADPDGTIASYNWSLSSGPTSGSVISNPNSENTIVSFNQPGTYQFKLTVTDNRGATDATTVTVTVTQEIVVQKTCATLDSIISDFSALNTADTAENFKLFTARYVDYKEIRAFYNLMVSSKVQSTTVADQIKFFIEQKIESRLATWIDNLKPFLLDFENLRLLALLMLNLHTKLAYYISCIQKDDVTKAAVKMEGALSSAINSLDGILQVVANFPDNHRNVLITLRSVTNTERTRVKNNNEETVKPVYVDILEKILSIFKEMNL
ncbi:MAG: PKD domain-containing protein, partial [Prolixibacteraceae bacterium]|nr:PKD domain-containing protein [Prolixibacteraceae bacterium]